MSLQFALFFRDIIDRPDLEFSDLNINLMNIFDAIPTIINIPRELPADVPIVSQRSNSNEYVCNISRSRIDLHYNKINEDISNSEVLIDFNSKVMRLISYLFKKRDFIRFGMICRYFHPDKNAIKVIKDKYFKATIGDVAELTIRFNQKSKMDSWDLNDMIEISAALALLNGNQEEGVFIQRDINNDVVSNKILTEEDLLKISKEQSELIGEKNIEELIK